MKYEPGKRRGSILIRKKESNNDLNDSAFHSLTNHGGSKFSTEMTPEELEQRKKMFYLAIRNRNWS